jgi:sulfur-oxidizing protein SoxX
VGKNVAKTFVGKTILTADQVESIVAYLSTLKQPAN